MTNHKLTTTATTWSCTCGRYGVFITLAERKYFQFCPGVKA